MRMRANCCCSCRDWGGEVFALHISGLGRGGKVIRAGKKDWRRRGTTAPIAVYCSRAAACTLSNRARWGFFGFQLVCCCCCCCCRSGKGRHEGSKQASKLSPPTPANPITIPLKPAFSINPSRSPFAHWPAAHCELIGKRRRPTLASMLQRGARS